MRKKHVPDTIIEDAEGYSVMTDAPVKAIRLLKLHLDAGLTVECLRYDYPERVSYCIIERNAKDDIAFWYSPSFIRCVDCMCTIGKHYRKLSHHIRKFERDGDSAAATLLLKYFVQPIPKALYNTWTFIEAETTKFQVKP